MENENVKVVADTLATSLDNTQKNATDTERSVQQVLSMSGKEMHDQTVSAILADGDLGMAEKLDLIHRENADYDLHQGNNTDRVMRMQTAQTQNVGKATSWWSENWGWVVFAGVAALALGTPQGRKALTTVAHHLAA